ncbi:MAG: hypothetical protein ABII02_01815, partial [Candidatus Magasanikbacteria bacterium]
MKFFESHFTKKSFFGTPHKWFLAFLISPIHAAEMHYKKKYHLNYLHAKKLFFFDMLLICSTLILGAATIFWYTYDPTVTDLVHVGVTASIDNKGIADVRAESGDLIHFSVSFQNNSDVLLQNPIITLSLPPGFLIQETVPSETFDASTQSFSIHDLAPRASGEVTFLGILYGTPALENAVRATLSYKQEARNVREQTHAGIIATLRGSKLMAEMAVPDVLLAQSKAEIKISISNTGERPISEVILPLDIDETLRLEILSQDIGETKGREWFLDTLAPGESVELEALLITSLPTNVTEKRIRLAPSIQVKDETFSQMPVEKNVRIVHPRLEMSTSWNTSIPAVSPGDILEMTIQLRNTSNATFEDVIISLPLPTGIVDVAKLARENHGYVRSGTFFITSDYEAKLKEIKPQESVSLTLTIPVRSSVEAGADPKLALTASLTASIQGVKTGTYSNSVSTDAVPVGGQIILSGESRYYTAGGDQLGRGPLPPEVGRETKYWALLSVKNTTSQLSNVRFSATLPSYIHWTGKSSVSRGNDVSYNVANRSVSWNLSSMSPNETIGIYF